MSDKISWTKTNRGKKMMIYKNNLYTLDKNIEGSERWRCRNRKCKGRIIINKNEDILNEIFHDHENDVLATKRHLAMIKIKENALNTMQKSSTVVTSVTSMEKEETVSNLPSRRAMVNSVNRLRNKKLDNFRPSQADIPAGLHKNTRGEQFLRFDSGVEDPARVVIFFSDLQEEIIKDSTTWLIDATFKSVPNHFCQLLTIHCEYLGKMIPCFHSLMIQKTQHSYERVFLFLFERIKKYPNSIIIDFEKALLNACKAIFSYTNIFGCNFHFGQIIWRHVQSLGLTMQYKGKTIYREIIRKCLALPFYPEEEINSQFILISEMAEKTVDNDNIKLFLNYFKKKFYNNQ